MASADLTTTARSTPSQDPLLSVIIPAFNEEGRLPQTLRDIRAYLAARKFHSEVIVVDDGSRDRTVEVARQFGPEVRVLVNETNRGKGYSVRRGLMEARGDYA